MKFLNTLLALLLFAVLGVAQAQSVGYQDSYIFTPISKTNAFAVTTAAHTPVQITTLTTSPPHPAGNTQYRLYNTGPQPAFITFAATSTNATLPSDGSAGNSIIVPVGLDIIVTAAPDQYVSLITASSTATVYVTEGFGK